MFWKGCRKKSPNSSGEIASNFIFFKLHLNFSKACPIFQSSFNEKEKEDNFEKYKNDILENSGHLLLSYDVKSRDAIYICGNCNEQNKTHMSNLHDKNLGSCSNCQNYKFRLSYDKLKKVVEIHGFQLLVL